jgi:hypothetical protein
MVGDFLIEFGDGWIFFLNWTFGDEALKVGY